MKEDRKFDLDDVAIVPSIVSEIDSRSECDIKTDGGYLPLMAAPMDTVVCEKNINRYIDNDIIPCVPRGLYHDYGSYNRNMVFQSYGLGEIEYDLKTLMDNRMKRDTDRPQYWRYKYVLIDIANGHMKRLVDALKLMKKHTPDVIVMVGNVAHPLTYKNLALAGADYVRCSIGTGAGCTTAANVAINYPMGSLIIECRQLKEEGKKSRPFIVSSPRRIRAVYIL